MHKSIVMFCDYQYKDELFQLQNTFRIITDESSKWSDRRVNKNLHTVCCGVLSAHSACPCCPHFLNSAFTQGQVRLLMTEQDNTRSHYLV